MDAQTAAAFGWEVKPAFACRGMGPFVGFSRYFREGESCRGILPLRFRALTRQEFDVGRLTRLVWKERGRELRQR
jgi:hypothetical protein